MDYMTENFADISSTSQLGENANESTIDSPAQTSTMLTLTKPQVKQLRGLAHPLSPLLLIGKNNITETVISQADQLLNDHELIKCQLQEGALLSTKEAAVELAEETGAAVVQTIGHRFVLFRPTRRKDMKNPIRLVRG